MRRTRKSDLSVLDLPTLDDNLAGFPKATITQLEEALEERMAHRRSNPAATYPAKRDRRKTDRRRTHQELALCFQD